MGFGIWDLGFGIWELGFRHTEPAGRYNLGMVTRREFLGALAAVAAPQLRFPKAAKERLAVATYPFRGFMRGDQPKLTLLDFAAMAADRFGVHGIEPLYSHFPSTEPAFLSDFRKAVERAHSRIVNIPVSVGASFYDADPARRDMAVANSRKWVDVAASLGCPSIRAHIQRAGTAAPDVKLAAEGLQAVAEYGAGKGVVINLENDDLASEDAFFLARVIDAAATPWLHALPDFGNSMLKGDEKFNYDAVTAMFRRAYNISHVKDSEAEGDKVFRVSLERTFAIARQAGYRGYFSMEWEGKGEPYAGTQFLVEQSLKLL